MPVHAIARATTGARIVALLRPRGVTFAVVPHWRATWIRWLSVVISDGRSKALFLAVLDGTSSDPEPVTFSSESENWAYGRKTLRYNRRRHHLRSHQLPRSRCNGTAARLASRIRGSRFLQS